MRLRRKRLVGTASIVAIGALLLAVALLTLADRGAASRAFQAAAASSRLVTELAASLDEQTNAARLYVVTGDKAYEDAHDHARDVRDRSEEHTSEL